MGGGVVHSGLKIPGLAVRDAGDGFPNVCVVVLVCQMYELFLCLCNYS